MRVLIVYGSTEGHTRELAHDLARRLHDESWPTAVEEAGFDPRHPDPSEYDAVFLAASLHVGRYQPALVAYARANQEILHARPAAFISVSLAAAGHNPHDWEDLDECLARFQHETLWTPGAVHQAAGAIRYAAYDFFKRLAIKHIVAEQGLKPSAAHDYDLTDRGALHAFAVDFVRQHLERAPAS